MMTVAVEQKGGKMKETIYREDAIDAVSGGMCSGWDCDVIDKLKAVPPAEPEQPTEIQEILKYIDEELYPIVAPDNWIIYSELHDMISELSTQPEQINPCTICQEFDCYGCKFRRTT